MRSIFSNNYESDNDERLDKKFSYNYQVIKRMYPKASELPESGKKNRSGSNYTDWIMRMKKR